MKRFSVKLLQICPTNWVADNLREYVRSRLVNSPEEDKSIIIETLPEPGEKLEDDSFHCGEQAMPIVNDHPAIALVVLRDLHREFGSSPIMDRIDADIKARTQVGIKRYGTALQPFNGRDQLRDAKEELLDYVHYLRNAVYEFEMNMELEKYQVFLGCYSSALASLVLFYKAEEATK